MTIVVGKRLWDTNGHPLPPPDPRLRGDAMPSWASPELGPNDIVYPGPGASLLAFTPVDNKTARARLVSADRVLKLEIPPVPAPYVHAFDHAGEHLFFSCAKQVVRVEVETGSSTVAHEGANLVQLFGPRRIACAGAWLGITSSERLTFIRFAGREVVETIWYTCRYGASMSALFDGRVLVAGAHAGGAVFAVDRDRIERVASLDARDIFAGWRGTGITAAWMTGETVCVQASECSEFDGRIEHSNTYALHGLTSAWTATYGPVAAVDERAVADAAARGQLYVSESAKPPTYEMPRAEVSSLSYPCAGPTGYAYGFKVSDRPGYWNSYIVSAKRIRALTPHWYSRITYHHFHETEPRLLLGSDQEVIEVDLPRCTWTSHSFTTKVRGVAYLGAFAAILTPEGLLLYDLANKRTVAEHPVETRDECELVTCLGGRVLVVPCKDGRGLFLSLRKEQLVVLGVLEGQPWTGGWSIQGRAFLKRKQPGYLEVHNLEAALRAAPALSEELDLLTAPAVIVTVSDEAPPAQTVDDELMDTSRLARVKSIVVAALGDRSFEAGEDEASISVSLDAGEFEVDSPRQVSFVVHVNINECPEWDQESAVTLGDDGLDELLALARTRLAAAGEDCDLRVRDKQRHW
jgi:hypothetical protein